MRIARAVALIFALMLAPWIEDRARDASSSGDAAFATTRRGPGDRETMTRFGASLVGALHDGNDTDYTVGVTVDDDGNPIGDAPGLGTPVLKYNNSSRAFCNSSNSSIASASDTFCAPP